MILSALPSALLFAAALALPSPQGSAPQATQELQASQPQAGTQGGALPKRAAAAAPSDLPPEAAASPEAWAPLTPPAPIAADGIFTLDSFPLPDRIDRVWAFNFVSSSINEIDGSSAGDASYTAWNFGFGSKWNNLRSRPITAEPNTPLPGDGAFSLDGQSWLQPFSGQGVLLDHMVNTTGQPRPGMRVTVEGSFSAYNTGGSPFGTMAGGVPPGWNYFQPNNVGSMGLSHLWIDGLFWNDTDVSVKVRITMVPNGTYLLACWLNPSNHDPLRTGRVTIQGQTFILDHIEGADYEAGNRLILANIKIRDEPFEFFWRSLVLDGINADSSLAGFSLLRLR